MRSLRSLWLRLFFEDIRPHSLAIIRIAVGATLMTLWILYFPRVPMLFSDAGIQIPFWDPALGGIASLLRAPSVSVAYGIYALLLLSSLGILLGIGYRISCALTLLLLVYYTLLSFHLFLASWGRLLFFTLIVLSMSGADRTLSLSVRRTLGRWTAWTPVPAWPQRLIAIQVAATYLGVGLQKAYIPDWQGGEIIAYTFINGWSTEFAHMIARQNIPMPVFDIAVILVKILHGLLPIGLWIRRYQWICFGCGAAFHIGVTLVMGMWWFLLLIPLYAAFVDPNSWKWLENNSHRSAISGGLLSSKPA